MTKRHVPFTGCIALLSCIAAPCFAATVTRSQLSKARSDASCNPPAAVTSFTTQDTEIWAFFAVGQGVTGDIARIEWRNPSGAVARATSYAAFSSNGNFCFNSSLSTATEVLRPAPGSWTVRLLLNGTALGTIPFQVTGDPVSISGVSNSADFSPVVAPGSIASVFGAGLSTVTTTLSALPFPTASNGVSVSVNGRPAPITYLSPAQVNFQVPAGTPPGTATITVTNAGQTSTAALFQVVAVSPGIFQYGANRGIVQNQDYTLNTEANPAAFDSAVIVYLTGVGRTTPSVADGAAAPGTPPLAVPAGRSSATIGGRDAPVLFLGLTPGSMGLAQANLKIPPMPAGDYPLIVTVSGQSSRPATISLRGGGGTSGGGGAAPEGLPEGVTCVSGDVDYVLFSLATKASRLADEVSIGGTKLCATCGLKPPLHGNLVEKLEAARTDNLRVDACYDSFGTMNYLRMRQ